MKRKRRKGVACLEETDEEPKAAAEDRKPTRLQLHPPSPLNRVLLLANGDPSQAGVLV